MLKKLAALMIIGASQLAVADEAHNPAEIVTAGLTAAFVDFDAGALPEFFAEDYIQHNPGVPTGLAPLQGFLPKLKEMGLAAEPHRMIVDGDLVAVHATYTNAQAFGAETMVAFDVFRVEDGKIAEHWDNLIPVKPANPSGHTQTDGPTEVTDLDQTDANKALVSDFVQKVLVGGDFAALSTFFDGDSYIQHNPDIADGLSGLGAAIEALADQGIAMEYETVHKVIGQGNFVLVMSEGAFGGEPMAYYDLFRVENGRIAEHWDVMQTIPVEMAHENGKF